MNVSLYKALSGVLKECRLNFKDIPRCRFFDIESKEVINISCNSNIMDMENSCNFTEKELKTYYYPFITYLDEAYNIVYSETRLDAGGNYLCFKIANLDEVFTIVKMKGY